MLAARGQESCSSSSREWVGSVGGFGFDVEVGGIFKKAILAF